MLNNIAGVLAPFGVVAGDYESIQTATVGSGGSSAITFNSIPSTYKHLQVRWIAKTNRNSADGHGPMQVVLNGATTPTNYYQHALYGTGSGTPTAEANNYNYVSYVASTTNITPFGVGIMDVLDYANSNKNTTLRTLGGFDNNGSGFVALDSNLWNNTAAVNSIAFYPFLGTLFTQYSHFALYGIKG